MSQTSSPLVSVVMGVYNESNKVCAAFESILDQKDVDLEFIVVNDGSTDSTPQILDEYAEKDKRVRIFHQQNAGLTKALIFGCNKARGRYIARQDADDISYPGRLAGQSVYLDEHEKVSVVSCWSEVRGPRGEYLYSEKQPSDPVEATRLLLEERTGPFHGTTMFRKTDYEQVGGYRPEFYFGQDADLWLRITQVGKIAYLPEVYYSLEISPGSISGALHGARLDYAALIDKCFELRCAGFDDRGAIQHFSEKKAATQTAITVISDGLKRKSRHRTNYFIGRCLLNNKDRRSLRYFQACLKDSPFSLRSWYGLLGAAACYLRPEMFVGNRPHL